MRLARAEKLGRSSAPLGTPAARRWLACHASDAHSRQSVLPVPVGLSNSAFLPCNLCEAR